jgi:hypothetical protein
MILGGGLLHLKFEPPLIYDNDTDGVLSRRGEPVWSANYCTVKTSQQHSNALVFADAVNDAEDLTYIGEHPHRSCKLDRRSFYLSTLSKDSKNSKERLHLVKKDAKPYLQLLRTCRQIYLEASRVLWTTNTFSFDNPKFLRMFMNDRKTAQKQLLKNLHLDMAWHRRTQKRDWERTLTLTLVRSLKGLRTLHLYIEQCLLNQASNFENKSDWETKILGDSYFQEIMKLKMLSLETVTVNIANGPSLSCLPDEGLQTWPSTGRTEWAERLKGQLLDPEGAARLQEQQDHQKELMRQEKEELAQARARSTCFDFSTEEECAEVHQKRQDDRDERAGRVRNGKKVAGPCGRQHMCLICYWKRFSGPDDAAEVARNCPQPGHCNEAENTTK